jgi:uncharacterized membrane protein HdeD (DUF308 family)
MNLPSEFFTVNSLLTLAGATAIVVVVTATISYLSDGKINPKWITFVLSELISFIGAFALAAPPENVDAAIRILIAFFNGCLIFATAVGLNTITTKPDGEAVPGKKKPYWARW